MKRIIIFFTVALLSMQVQAADSFDYFEIDEDAIEQEFADLEMIENAVISSSEMNISALKKEHPEATTKLIDADLMHMTNANVIDDMNWGAFAWGFCCCPIGFFVVAISDDSDNIAKQSYWIGVLVGFTINTITNIIYFATGG